MNDKNVAIHRLCGRLVLALGVLLGSVAFVLYFSQMLVGFFPATPFVAVVVGAVGGFVSLQRRLKNLSPDDLELLSHSWYYTIQAPLVGGILSLLLYILFLSELVQGELFPVFVPDTALSPESAEKFEVLFANHGAVKDYAKLIFWGFLAGYSETFVTNMIGQFENDGGNPRR